MKKILFIVILLQVISMAQNKTYIDSTSKKVNLIGITTPDAFKDTTFAWWYNSEKDIFKPDTETIDQFKDKICCYDIKIVMATWCSDSRRDVPRLMEILEYCDYPMEQLTIINVDRKRQDGIGLVNPEDIKLVPTTIFYKKGKEAGRIVESAMETLEKDILKIIIESSN